MENITILCTGCRTCEQLCPTRSIKMEPDREGFLTPVIDHSTCIDCKLCKKRCPQNTKVPALTPISVYAFRYIDDKKLYQSASGGAFVAIAQYIIEKGGGVYGAAYIDDNLHVAHIKVNDSQGLDRLQSSKYVQSNTLQTFRAVQDDLKAGVWVLYSGTPCQIAGLKAFLKKDFDKLLTADVICHGVPSPLLFEKYIIWQSSKMSKIVKYNFRDKGAGWGLDYRITSKTGKEKSLSGVLDPYYYHFLEGNTYRECCYQCRYAKPERISDITIGDYWGIKKEHPEFYSTKGVSCVLVNTEKGRVFFNAIKDDALIVKSSFEKVASQNGNLLRPTKRKKVRDDIYIGINNESLDVLFDVNLRFPKPLKSLIKAYVPKKLKLLFKKINVK